MNVSEFVLWYVNKIYMFTGSKIKIKYSDDYISFSEFVGNVKSSLNISIVDNKDMYTFLSSWYLLKQKEGKNDLLDYIRFKYKVTLGDTNWEIMTMNNKPVKISDIVLNIKNKYDSDFVEKVVKYWFENEIISASEKLISNFN